MKGSIIRYFLYPLSNAVPKIWKFQLNFKLRCSLSFGQLCYIDISWLHCSMLVSQELENVNYFRTFFSLLAFSFSWGGTLVSNVSYLQFSLILHFLCGSSSTHISSRLHYTFSPHYQTKVINCSEAALVWSGLINIITPSYSSQKNIF